MTSAGNPAVKTAARPDGGGRRLPLPWLGVVPFLLYVGRHDHGKNLDGLLADFGRYRARGGRMRLVRVGAGALPVPSRLREAVVDLGVLSEQGKLDAGAAATALCVPGVNESFSIVLSAI